MKIKDSITIKIVTSMSLCIIFFSSFGIFAASAFYSHRFTQNSIQVNEQYLSIIIKQLENNFQELQKLSGFCSSSTCIAAALRCDSLSSVSARKKCLDAQTELDMLSASTPLYEYLQRAAILNDKGICIASMKGMEVWENQDWNTLQTFIASGKADSLSIPSYQWYSLLDSSKNDCISFLAPLLSVPDSYLYVELDESIFEDQLVPYRNLREIFITDTSGSRLLTSFTVEESEREDLTEKLLHSDGKRITYKGYSYQPSLHDTAYFNLVVGSLNDVTAFAGDNLYVLYVMLILFAATVCAGILVTRVMTKRITQPISVLTGHIRRLAETNDFSPNPAIEASGDEIGEIGRAVNHMILHIQMLLQEQAVMYEQKKNMEINLLQSQINPHFLYNTLDSIRWMAVISGNKSIELLTHSLEHLLRNIAKGIDDKITLREELSLVSDYIHIQQVRYVEIFDYICQIPENLLDCTIIKFTLQPIVENAILHGIVPTNQFGEIEISAREENNDLYLIIEDNGVGMTKEELQKLQDTLSPKNKNALGSIGIFNVDARLKLHYGSSYGLTYESSPGEFTRVTIHIPKEEAVPCTTYSS